MKIGIDARMYSQSGIGRYLQNLIASLQKLDKQNEYFIFLRKEEFESLVFKQNFKKVLADFSWYTVIEQIKMPRLLNKYNLDLVHFPHFNVPILYSGKFVVTIHDLIHQHFQMKRATTHGFFTYKLKQMSYKKVFKYAVTKSQKVLTPSNFVRDSLFKEWRVKEDKINVTYEGVDDKIISTAKEMSKSKAQQILSDLNIEYPYLFYLGNAHPHKNVESLIEVFLKLQSKYKQLNLVLSGNDHYFWRVLQSEMIQKGLDENIRFTGYVTDEQVVALYRNAVCLCLPSFEEGFGIPVLEAFACKCPVVCSNVASLPEVAGDAAVFFDPKDKNSMYESIEKILNSERLRQELIKKGEKRYKEFSWEKLAKHTLQIYESSIKSSS